MSEDITIKDRELESEKAVDLGGGITRVLANNPGIMTGPGTNTYLIEGGEGIAVIDPGPDDAIHIKTIERASSSPIKWIFVTHTHIDHSPGAKLLKELTGAKVFGFDSRDGFFADVELREGSTVDLGGRITLKSVYTPGHASNHLCYLSSVHKVIFTGDHVMSGSTVVIAPKDGDMKVYIESLEKLKDMIVQNGDFNLIAPGHGGLISEAEVAIDEYINHRFKREEMIRRFIEQRSECTIDEVVREVYKSVDKALHPIAKYSVWAHLRKLNDEKIIYSHEPDDIESVWKAWQKKD